MRRVATYVAGAIVVWIALLALGGALYGGRAGQRVADRIASSLAAEVTIGHTDLRLVRGGLVMSDLAVRKEDLGHLTIDIGSIACDLRPLGLAVLDRTCGDLVIDRVRLEVSTLAVFRFKKPKRRPLRADRVEIRDAKLALMPSAFVPGLGRVEIDVDRVVAGPTVFKTPLSWLFSMRELRATLALPADVTIELHYANGVLRAKGALFGSTPIALPIALPVADAADDAQAEMAKLVAFGRRVAEQIVARRATDWLRSKLSP